MGNTLIDLEIALVKAFNWSLHDIDETNIESLLPFIARINEESGGHSMKRVYADQVDWL